VEENHVEEKNVEAKNEEKCTPCELSVAAGMVLNVCKELNASDLNCSDLEEKFLAGEITLKELVDMIEPRVKEKSHRLVFEFLKKEKSELMRLRLPEAVDSDQS